MRIPHWHIDLCPSTSKSPKVRDKFARSDILWKIIQILKTSDCIDPKTYRILCVVELIDNEMLTEEQYEQICWW